MCHDGEELVHFMNEQLRMLALSLQVSKGRQIFVHDQGQGYFDGSVDLAHESLDAVDRGAFETPHLKAQHHGQHVKGGLSDDCTWGLATRALVRRVHGRSASSECVGEQRGLCLLGYLKWHVDERLAGHRSFTTVPAGGVCSIDARESEMGNAFAVGGRSSGAFVKPFEQAKQEFEGVVGFKARELTRLAPQRLQNLVWNEWRAYPRVQLHEQPVQLTCQTRFQCSVEQVFIVAEL